MTRVPSDLKLLISKCKYLERPVTEKREEAALNISQTTETVKTRPTQKRNGWKPEIPARYTYRFDREAQTARIRWSDWIDLEQRDGRNHIGKSFITNIAIKKQSTTNALTNSNSTSNTSQMNTITAFTSYQIPVRPIRRECHLPTCRRKPT